MVWARFDERYRTSRKVAALSDAAFRLDVEAIMWSNDVGADGQVRAHELTQIRAKATKRTAAELVAAGRWHVAGAECPSAVCPPSGSDGWVIHDYWDQQPKRDDVIKERAEKAERQRKYMEKLRAAKKGKKDGTTDASADAPLTSTPSPSPPRPEGRGGLRPPAPPAAVGGVAAAGGGSGDQNPRDSIQCTRCGNALGSAYHRNVCREAA